MPTAAIHTLDRDAGPLEGPAAGSWSLALWSNPWERAFGDCGEMDQGEVGKEIVGNASGGKPGSHGSKAILLSHVSGWSHHQSLCLSAQPASAAEQ